MTIIARRRFILLVSFGYAIFGLCWIFFSDSVLASFVDLEAMVWLSEAKGAFFVLATAICLFFALRAVPAPTAVGSERLFSMLVEGESPKRRPAWLTYSVAVLMTLLMLVVRHSLRIEFGERPLLNLFMFPIILSALLGGLGPGLVSTLVAAIGINYTLVAPAHTLHIASGYDALQIGVLVANGIAVSVLSAVMKRSHAAGEANRRLLDAVVSGTTDGVLVKDTLGRYLLVNAAAARVLGRPANEIIGQDNSRLLTGVAARAVSLVEKGVLETATVSTYEQAHTGADGEQRIYLVSKGPVTDDTGNVVGIFGVSRDITAQKQTETALRASEQRFHDIASASADWVWEMDTEARYTYASEGVGKLLGYSADEMIGKTVFDLMPADRVEEFRTRFTAITGRRESFRDLPAVCHHRNGGLRRVLMNGVPVLDLNNVFLGYRGLDRDVTDSARDAEELAQHRKHLEEMVAERTRQLEAANRSHLQQQQFIRTVADAIPSLVAYWDTNLICRFSNAQYVEWFGWEPAKMLGVHIREVVGEELFALKEPHLRKALIGERQQFYWTQLKEDGSVRYVFSTYIPDIADERVRGLYVLSSDISEIKKAELQLVALNEQLAVRAHEAEAANQAKSAFVANMSHEIRTPMNAIVGLTHLLRRANPTPQQAERLDKIESAGRHLLSIINDILDVSKIEAGRLKLETVDFHLSSILDNVHSIIADEARAKGLVVEVDTDGVPLWLRGDPTRLRQALLNYAGNAIKFTERGAIAIRSVLLQEAAERVLVRFEVEDTGIGVAEEILPGLFQTFEQADASTTRRFGGTGLGLSITRRLAAMMGGEAGASSKQGRGSVFWFTAWLARGHGVTIAAPVEVQTSAELSLRACGGARLLLVEDNAINREVAIELIRAAGLSVDTAENGHEAVAMASAGRYDLVLMDMQMPELDGLDATRAIRRLPGWEHIPIVAMTANAFDDDRIACREAGMDDFIAKPVDAQVFFSTLRKWLKPAIGTAPDTAPLNVPREPAGLTGLPQIDGIDTAIGLTYVNSNTAKYLTLLKKFCDQHAVSFSDTYHANRINSDWDGIRRLAHTLKGLALSLGATRLGKLAGELELAARDLQTARADELARDVESELAGIIKGMAQLDDASGGAAESMTASAPPDALVGRLKALLAMRDTAADKCFRELTASVQGHRDGIEMIDATRLAAIGQAIARYDYAAALQHLEQMSTEPGNQQGDSK